MYFLFLNELKFYISFIENKVIVLSFFRNVQKAKWIIEPNSAKRTMLKFSMDDSTSGNRTQDGLKVKFCLSFVVLIFLFVK